MRYAGWLGYAAAGGTAIAAASYVVVYLYRWEWQRALLSGVLLLVVEVLVAAALILTRLGTLQRRLSLADARTAEVLRRLRQQDGPGGGRQDQAAESAAFRWLGVGGGGGGGGGGGSSFVFVPVLVAAGAALSGIALIIQRLGGVTVRPTVERRLAGRLAALTAPPGGIRAGAGLAVLADQPAVPPRARPLRVARGLAGILAVAALLAAAVDLISDATQTRPHPDARAAATVVVFQVEVRDGGGHAARSQAARELWEGCQRSTAAPHEDEALSSLGGGVFAGALRPALTAHDLLRLRGCLSDTRARRALATVLGDAQAR